ncbi:MAG TPA: hypothetical protein VN366_11220, partial [Feifaniaceae bacterium]|nr:hypothetical protein [Feifaniaceae bacterium]
GNMPQKTPVPSSSFSNPLFKQRRSLPSPRKNAAKQRKCIRSYCVLILQPKMLPLTFLSAYIRIALNSSPEFKKR